MKLFRIFPLFIGLFLFSGYQKQNRLTAHLLKLNKENQLFDTIKQFNPSYRPGDTIDLTFCIKNFNYPPSLPKNIQLKIPASPFRSFNQKSIYDENGRLIKYFYHGSMVSGIIPYGYDFFYENDTSSVISFLKDEFDNSIYLINYTKNGSIASIELSDTSGISERLILQY